VRRLFRWFFWLLFRFPASQHETFEYLYEKSVQYRKLTVWERRQAYAATFNTPNGEYVLWDMWKYTTDRSSLELPKPDPLVMAFREGERSVYQNIIHLLEQAKHPEWFKGKEK
jgi:hypothetical protein